MTATLPQHPELARAFDLAAGGHGGDAAAIVERLAEAGEADALYVWADMHFKGKIVPRSRARGRALFEAAAEAGNVEAGFLATNLLASGVAGSRDWPAALARLRTEAKIDRRRAETLTLIDAMDLDDAGDPATPPVAERLPGAPETWLVRGLFTPDERYYLATLVGSLLAPSMVTADDLSQMRDPVRTSDSATINWLIEDPAVHALNRRIAAASGTAAECGEPMQILRYSPGQAYYRHLDALPGLANQRVRTALVYLNDTYAGGETAFTRTGRMIKGAAGDAIVFANTGADGRPDPMSEHEGMPVTDGVKYLASRWIRARPIGDEE